MISRLKNIYSKLAINLLFFVLTAFYTRCKDIKMYIPAVVFVLINVFVIIYIFSCRASYEEFFLQLTYNPSNVLIWIMFVVEIGAIVLFYYLLNCYILGLPHLFLILLIYIYIYQNRFKQKTVIKRNMKMRFEYGVLNETIENSPLYKGSFVKISRRTADKVVVKDYNNNEYEIESGMIGQINVIDLN
ncbi:hypothetical protein NUSPORA_02887 [Nucleospora cyclopteri]